MSLRTEGTINEFVCLCGFKGRPGSFLEDKGSFRCPLCNAIVVTMDDIVQVALRSVQVVDYLDEFMVALREQLLSDAKRWGDAWLDKKDVEEQEQGFLGKVIDYLKDFKRESPLNLPGIFYRQFRCLG